MVLGLSLVSIKKYLVLIDKLYGFSRKLLNGNRTFLNMGKAVDEFCMAMVAKLIIMFKTAYKGGEIRGLKVFMVK